MKFILRLPIVTRLIVCLLLVVFGSIETAAAHGMDAGTLAVTLEETSAQVVASPYVTVFHFADDDGNDLLTLAEVSAHRSEINALIETHVRLHNEAGVPADITLIDALIPADMAEADHLQVRVRFRWDVAPEAVDVQYSLFASESDLDAEGKVSWMMQDIRGGEIVEGTFTPQETLFRLRGEDEPALVKPQLWLSGVQHVLEGYDHILFIIGLVLVTASLRTLLIPLTAFTVAHTITLAAVAFGFNPPLSSWFIEAAIAASIAVLVGLNLLGKDADRLWWVTGLIGLIHGLGFGQALAGSLGNLQQWGSALIAITVGVELTHLTIALITLGGLALVRKPEHTRLIQRTVGIIIVTISLLWTVQRILIP